jgi:hypothetical protein
MPHALARLRAAATLAALLAVPVAAGAAPPLLADGFETGPVDAAPAGWLVPPGLRAQGVTALVVAGNAGAGERSARLRRSGPPGPANLMRSIDAGPCRGRRLRFSALVRSDRAGAPAQLWLRVDRPDGAPGFIDTMADRPIRDDVGTRQEIVAPVADDALAISFGLLLNGSGTAWIDDVRLEDLGPVAAAAAPPAPIDERGLVNLLALARLLGDLRHFHPSDEAAAAAWPSVVVIAVRAVEGAADDAALAERLEAALGPLAPTMALRRHDGAAPPAFPSPAPPAGASAVLAWQHRGFGGSVLTTTRSGPYRSERVRRAPGADGEPAEGESSVRRLTAGLWSRVPLTVAADERRSLPAAGGQPAIERRLPHPDGWYAASEDRATRLASVILLWNVLQHFYPYFDVVEVDWAAVLPETLRAAAVAGDPEAFTAALERMIAALDDGHGSVSDRHAAPWTLPVAAAWIGDELVVTAAAPPLAPGDVIVSIDGRTVAELYDELTPRISAATEGWRRAVAGRRILRCRTRARAFVEGRRPDGTVYSAALDPVGMAPSPPRPEPIGEIEPGIWYVDIDRTDDDAFRAALPQLATAAGLVFDLRGYPNRLSTVLLAHLVDEPARSAQWHVPLVRRPDRVGMSFEQSGWSVQPAEPHLGGRAVFITDGRAISAAETYLGIVEAYGLAEIVGSPTAGTNGNVNTVMLPSGHTVAFTGMKVLKHDGSRHHGVGIHPTVPARPSVRGIAAGRDELLERAAELVRPR